MLAGLRKNLQNSKFAIDNFRVGQDTVPSVEAEMYCTEGSWQDAGY